MVLLKLTSSELDFEVEVVLRETDRNCDKLWDAEAVTSLLSV